MFYGVDSFEKKYNNKYKIPLDTVSIKKWINENKDKINEIYLKSQHGEEIENFFSNIKSKETTLKM